MKRDWKRARAVAGSPDGRLLKLSRWDLMVVCTRVAVVAVVAVVR